MQHEFEIFNVPGQRPDLCPGIHCARCERDDVSGARYPPGARLQSGDSTEMRRSPDAVGRVATDIEWRSRGSNYRRRAAAAASGRSMDVVWIARPSINRVDSLLAFGN